MFLPQVEMNTKFFRSFFAENEVLTKPAVLLPSGLDEDSAVVKLKSKNRSAGEILRVSKVKGGNRVEAVHSAAMRVVPQHREEKATVWLTV